jgi:hypothetical protein
LQITIYTNFKQAVLNAISVKYCPLLMALMVSSKRNWRAVEGIWQLDRLAYVVFF